MALTKAQALLLSEPVEQMYMDCTAQLIINISRHFETGKGLATQAWEAQKLAEMGQLTDESIEIIAANTGQKAEAVRAALYQGIKDGLAGEEALLQNAAAKGYITTAAGTLETSMQVRNLVDAYAAQADDQLNLVNTVMLQSTQNRYFMAIQQVVSIEEAAKIEALTSAHNATELAAQMGKAQQILNAATGSTLLGNEARTKALRTAIKSLADQGITGFIDAGGHHWTPEAYVNMDIRTTVGNVARQAQKARAAEFGVDTFQVSRHAAARPLCAPYQGWICSWTGGGYSVQDLYGNSYHVHDIAETSYGEPAGLFGINCGHNPLTFVPGFSVPRYDELTPEEEAANATQYAQSQQQRHLERQVRQAKTEALAYKAAGDEEGFALASAKVKQTQADYKAFCNATNRTPRPDRLQVYGYNRSVSSKASAATRKFKPTPKPPKAVKPAPIIKPDVPAVPVVPPAPVVQPFVPAQTIAEAEAAIGRIIDPSRFGALGVSYAGVDLNVANRINKTLLELYDIYDVPKFGGIVAPAGNTKLGKLINGATAGYSPVRHSFVLNRKSLGTVKKAEAAFAADRQAINDILTHPERYDMARASRGLRSVVEHAAKSGRGTVPETIEEALMHEFGHALEKGVKNSPAWEAIKSNMAIFADNISGYAAQDPGEYIAESFASYRKGETVADPELIRVFEELKR